MGRGGGGVLVRCFGVVWVLDCLYFYLMMNTFDDGVRHVRDAVTGDCDSCELGL